MTGSPGFRAKSTFGQGVAVGHSLLGASESTAEATKHLRRDRSKGFSLPFETHTGGAAESADQRGRVRPQVYQRVVRSVAAKY